MITNYSDITDQLMIVLKAGLVPMIHGSPGLGKSDIIKSIAKTNKLKLIDFRLSQADSTDLNGFPSKTEEGRSTYLPPEDFPLGADKIPDGYNGWLLFFDEINSAPPLVQAAAYKIILDRQVGKHNLHSNVAIIAAGNLTSDKAIVNRLSTAMQSRMVHFTLEADANHWLQWAHKNKIDYRVIGFIDYRPEMLFKFDPKHADNTFPCPRTWHFLSREIENEKEITPIYLPIMAGTVGEGAAIEFNGFLSVYGKIPSFEDILTKGSTLEVPEQPDMLYAVTSLLSSKVDEGNIERAIKYINRIPVEFQVTCMKVLKSKNKKISSTKEFKKWISDNAYLAST